jgi:hypothetical protein
LRQGLYGNNTDLTSAVKVEAGASLTVAGKWFAPGNVEILWDGTYLDAAKVDGAGYFSKAVTVPAADVGVHTVTVSNGNAQFLVTVTVSPAPSVSDSDDSQSTLSTPSPSPMLPPSPSPSPSTTPSPTTPPQPTPTPDPQPPKGLQLILYVLASVAAFVLAGAVIFVLRKKW